MTLIEKLRHATSHAHEELDTALLPRIKNIHNTDDYIALLAAFYGYFKPVYEKIDAHLNVALLPDYATRRKPAHLLKNLDALATHLSVNNFCQQLPRIHDNASAFGALYVMEGSTLGGLMIKKMIAEQTGLPDEQLSFFAGYGRETRGRWHTFVTALNQITQDKNEEQTAIETASQTFTAFKNWLTATFF